MTRCYEALREASLGGAGPVPLGAGVFHVRGMTGWLQALPALAVPPSPDEAAAGDRRSARARASDLVPVLADMILARWEATP